MGPTSHISIRRKWIAIVVSKNVSLVQLWKLKYEFQSLWAKCLTTHWDQSTIEFHKTLCLECHSIKENHIQSHAQMYYYYSQKLFWIRKIKISCFWRILFISYWFHPTDKAMIYKELLNHTWHLTCWKVWTSTRAGVWKNWQYFRCLPISKRFELFSCVFVQFPCWEIPHT